MQVPQHLEDTSGPGVSSVPRLIAKNIVKSFGAIKALKGVNVEFRANEIHALVGENGAGKSTLKKALAGEIRVEHGEIAINGKIVNLDNPISARRNGIAVVHQHFPLCEALSVAENLHFGAPPLREPKWLHLINHSKMIDDARASLDPFGVADIAIRPVRSLSVVERQVVAIATALKRKSEIIILDEPTSSLNKDEIDTLFKNMRRLRDQGATIIFITHSIEEVLAVAERVTVLRDGMRIDTVEVDSIDSVQLIRMIVGRELADAYPKASVKIGNQVLQLQDVSLLGDKTISLSLGAGEILGFPSLLGSGVVEILDGTSGRNPFRSGKFEFNGFNHTKTNISQKIKAGICLVPGDATLEGLIPKLTIQENILLSNRDKFTKFGVIRGSKLRSFCHELISLLDIRPNNPSTVVEYLSGGNRQKVVIAKCLAAGAKLMVMDDPTKGVDVGAKIEIYSVIGDILSKGKSVILGSTDLDELIGISDRIIVIRDGNFAGEFSRKKFDKVTIMNRFIGSRESASMEH